METTITACLKVLYTRLATPNDRKNICKNRKGCSPCLNGVLIIQSWDWGGTKTEISPVDV